MSGAAPCHRGDPSLRQHHVTAANAGERTPGLRDATLHPHVTPANAGVQVTMRPVQLGRAPSLLALALILLAATPTLAAPRPWTVLPTPPAAPAPTADGHVAVSGDASIYWAAYGDTGTTASSDPLIVLLHGGLGSGDDFALQIPVLVASAHRVITLDTRGHGRSTLGTTALSYHAMGEDVVAVLDALHIDRAVLVGWSDGGTTALDVAVSHPTRVAGLAILDANADSSGLIPHRASSPASATFDAYAARAKSEFARLSPATGTSTRWAALHRALRPVWAAQGGLSAASLHALAIPTAIIAGAHDEIIRQDHFATLAKRIPGAKLVIIAGASHFALWQTPDAVTAATLDLLARVTAPPARP